MVPVWRRCLCRLARVAALVLLSTLPALGADQLFSYSRPAMGTKFTIYLYAPDQASASAAFDASFDEIERIEEALSNYRDTSELSRINREAAEHEVTTDPEVFHFLQTSLDFARRSDGAFDITVGPLMRAWGFFRGEGRYPTPAQLATARAHIGWQHVKLDAAARTVRFDEPGIELDPGGIGKGFAVDRVVTILRDAGIRAALVDAGGSTIYALGAPPGRDGWTVRVPDPVNKRRTLSAVSLRDTSLSTSGNYEKFFRLAGHVYCHIMDPRTGEPVQGMLQTTVIAPDATTSDALSTSIFVLGPKASETLLRSSGATAALWVQGAAASRRIAKWHWPGQQGDTK
jgi:thiamine biosynthesis lipoprotein